MFSALCGFEGDALSVDVNAARIIYDHLQPTATSLCSRGTAPSVLRALIEPFQKEELHALAST